MKRAIFAIMVATGLAVNTGCQTLGGQGGCSSCGGGCEDGSCTQGGGQAECQGCQDGCESCQGHPRMSALKNHMHGDPQMMDAGPASAAITYPYYTTRGPRDFFEPNPPTIGR